MMQDYPLNEPESRVFHRNGATFAPRAQSDCPAEPRIHQKIGGIFAKPDKLSWQIVPEIWISFARKRPHLFGCTGAKYLIWIWII